MMVMLAWVMALIRHGVRTPMQWSPTTETPGFRGDQLAPFRQSLSISITCLKP